MGGASPTRGTSPAGKLQVVPAGFFALRTPLLPFSTLTEWADGLRAPAAAGVELEAALAADRRLLRERLRALVARPEVREALFVASPSLDDSLPAWLEHPDGEHGQKVERTLARYLARMAGRPTPFGLFAGCSVGRSGATTRLVVDAGSGYRRHTRLDGDYLSALTDAIGRDPALRRAAIFRPNSSLYQTSGRLHYAEARLQGTVRSYHLVALESTDYLLATLARAAGGARLDVLAEALVDDTVSREEAEAFIGELVDHQVLVSDLQPQVTGAEPIHDLVDQLAREPATRPLSARLDGARQALARLDAAPPGVAPADYRAIAAGLDGLPAPVELSRLFQVDLVKPAPEALLGAEVTGELVRAVELLRRMTPPPRDNALSRFRDAFTRRFEAREVALTEALDEEAGIGFERSTAPTAEPSPLLDGLAFDGRGDDPPDEQVAWGPRANLLLRRLGEALRAGAGEIVLQDSDLEQLARKQPVQLGGSMAVMATVAARSEADFTGGDFLVWVHGAMGPSGANLLGRFCHGDPELTRLVVDHLRAEEAQRPGAVFAEIVHLPEGRIGNVLLRPLLREYEIPFLGRSGAPADKQIGVDDLLVSVRAGRVVLRSRRLGREVIPRLTTAHNFSSPRNLGMYRFLCALQQQDGAGLSFSWGVLDGAPFLPRVRSGRLVLALARWRLERDQLQPLGAAKGAARFAAVQGLRRAFALPRWVAVADGDNVLPVDLDNALGVDTFVHLVKDRPSVKLTELFEPERLCARGPEGGFVHELVVPLLAAGAAAPALAPPPREPAAAPVPRLSPPGSDWLYAKLYCGPAAVDGLLRDALAPVVREALASGAARSWFFIRYADPDWHLRIRFRGDPARLHGEVLPALQAAAAEGIGAGRVWKLQLDTYEREIERYGGDEGILLAEDVFCADSDACLTIVDNLWGDDAADARWRLALRGMDMLLDDLGLDAAAKQAVIGAARLGFGAEFHAAGLLDRQLGARFRSERLALEALLDPAHDAGSELEPGLDALKARSQRILPIAAALRERERGGRLTQPIAALAGSFLHMHANRLLRASARAQELVLYDFLDRLYRGRAARGAGR